MTKVFKIVLFSVLCLCLMLILKIITLKNVNYKRPRFLENKKVLVVYYSNSGHTKKIAENIRNVVGGDIKQIELVEKYPAKRVAMSKIVKQQMKENHLPAIEWLDISDYDVVFVGSPIWNGKISLPTKAFLSTQDFEHKIIIPFFTYSGGAMRGKISDEIYTITKNAKMLRAKFFFGNGICLQKQQIMKWLNELSAEE